MGVEPKIISPSSWLSVDGCLARGSRFHPLLPDECSSLSPQRTSHMDQDSMDSLTLSLGSMLAWESKRSVFLSLSRENTSLTLLSGRTSGVL